MDYLKPNNSMYTTIVDDELYYESYEDYLCDEWLESIEVNTDVLDNELYEITSSYYDEFEKDYIEYLIKNEPKEDDIMDLEQMFKNRGEGKCPFCRNDISENEFRDELSLKEFKISGLCQKCQDSFFGGE